MAACAKSATAPSRAATIGLLLVLLASGAKARDMYVLMEHAPMPALMHEGKMWCALADLDQRENYSAGGYHLFIHDFTTYRDSFVCDTGLIDSINCLAQNGRSIFAGGRGLSVFDKVKRQWRQWDSLDRFRIWDVEATDSVLWLATDRHGVVRCNLSDSSLRRITTQQGLASNSVFSLYLQGDTLFAGPFRYGKDGWPERKEDWFGRGLDAINARTREVRHVSLPVVPDPYDVSKRWLVTDMYPSPDSPGRMRCVLWYPWTPWCWDRSDSGAELLTTGHTRPVADGVLSRCGADTVLRTKVIKYLVRTGFAWAETQLLIAELAEGSAGPRRFPRHDYQAVSPADYERVRRFYLDAAGFVLYREAGTSACCLVLEDQLLLYLEGTDERTLLAGSRTHPQFELPAATNAALYQRLKAAGVPCRPDTLSWYWGFEFEDPTGNPIRSVSEPDRRR